MSRNLNDLEEEDTFKKEWEEALKTGYTVKQAEEILIQRIRERWKQRSSESNQFDKPKQ